jgi:hypothetical protein
MAVEPNDFESEPEAHEPRVLPFPAPPAASSSGPAPLKSLPPLRTLPQFQNQRPRRHSIFRPGGLSRMWNRCDLGEKTMLIAACTAAFSMCLAWTDFSFVSLSGIQQDKYFYLAIFIYPVAALLRQGRANRWAAVALGSGGIYLAVSYIMSTTVDYGDIQRRFAGDGPYLFALSSAALIAGALISRRRVRD